MTVDIPTLTYFSSRGLCEPIRFVLSEARVNYKEVGVGAYNPNDQPKEFLELIESGKLPFNQLPIWEEPTGFVLSQSNAILRHLARKYKLYGDSIEENGLVDSIMDAIWDLKYLLRQQHLNEQDKVFEVTLPKYFKFFERILEKNRLIESLKVNDLNERFNFSQFPLLQKIYKSVSARPGILKHLESSTRYPAQVFFSPRK
ncbi:hypothetical protein HK099_001025 [Clydaea vesicula]|uniref:GST N-terminal domain-containing protein n=1 Tax=Clydaea vesicula TaxID=447962 RepID=A0AAD5XSC4_9FUNG|nr:hypothetical protein HK099_001025 [Clydaea vesicula]